MDGSDKKKPQDPESGSWQYKPEGTQKASFADGHDRVSQAAPTSADDTVEWTASEFVAHDKGVGWYVLLATGAIVVAVFTYLITRDRFSVGVIILFAVILGIIGARKPRVVTYRLDSSGVKIGARFHPYSEYKSFALREEQPFASIELVPMKRFDFPLGIYLAPENEHEVLNVLTRHLPLERGELDGAERLMRRLRF